VGAVFGVRLLNRGEIADRVERTLRMGGFVSLPKAFGAKRVIGYRCAFMTEVGGAQFRSHAGRAGSGREVDQSQR
jgi:hypothetical protein